jgi:hypothetical protein
MQRDQLEIDAGPLLNDRLGGIAGHVGRQRYERNRKEEREGAAHQVVALLGECQQQESEGDDRADGRNVIEQ